MTTTAAVSMPPAPVVAGPLPIRGRRVWMWWALSRAACLAVVIASLHAGNTSPIFGFARDVTHVYRTDATKIHAGLVPYRDFAFEYPPGTLPFLLPWPRLGTEVYVAVYGLQMVLVDALILRSLQSSGGPTAESASILWVSGGALALGLPLCRNDLPSCLVVVLGLLAYLRGRRLLGAVALALGAVAKVWPATLLALMTVVLPRAARSTAVAVVGVGAYFLAPLALLGAGPGLWHDVVGYHSGRGVEVEATAAVPALLWGALDGRGVDLSNDHGSTNLAHSTGLATVCTGVGIVVLAAVLLLGWRLRRRAGQVAAADLTTLACLVVVTSLLTAKVFSAQYAIWLVTVACVGRAYGGVDRTEARIVLGTVLAATLVFPLNFFLVGDGGVAGMAPATVLLARDIALLVLSVRWTRRVLAAGP